MIACSGFCQAERLGLVRAHVEERVGRVVAIGNGHGLDPRESLFSMGLDSLMAMELTTALKASLAAPLPPTLLFDHPTIDGLSAFLTQLLFADPRRIHTATDAPPDDADIVAQVRNLAPAELEAAIAEKLRLLVVEDE